MDSYRGLRRERIQRTTPAGRERRPPAAISRIVIRATLQSNRRGSQERIFTRPQQLIGVLTVVPNLKTQLVVMPSASSMRCTVTYRSGMCCFAGSSRSRESRCSCVLSEGEQYLRRKWSAPAATHPEAMLRSVGWTSCSVRSGGLRLTKGTDVPARVKIKLTASDIRLDAPVYIF